LERLFGREDAPAHGAANDGTVDATGGTLFLDEIDQLSQDGQLRFLRYLQDHRDVRDKGSQPFRVIAASAEDLQHEVASGRFREDLYYRLNVVTLRTPALRERREDILLLANHFLRTFAMQGRKGIDGFTERALAVMFNFDWPGNIRQLETCVQRAVAVCKEAEIEPRHLPREIMTTSHGTDAAPRIPGSSLRDIERYAILRTLEHVGGSTSKAARILGISPRKIQYRLNEYRESEPSGVPALSAEPNHRIAQDS
jgi:two-component system response regulator HydG